MLLSKERCYPNLFVRMKKWRNLPYVTWGPFLENPGNFSGPKSDFQIEI